jgi:ribosomal protein S18 acetylase RimI-like enzyme
MSTTQIEAVTEVTPELLESMARLIPQLSPLAAIPTAEELRQILASPIITLLVARTDGVLSGMLTLIVFRVATGMRGIIEDVVVDERYRGQGIAELLTREALTHARAAGLRTVNLTSRPAREAANRLYERMGFERRETNAYVYSL